MIYPPLIFTLLFVGPALASIAIKRNLAIRWQLLLLSIIVFYGISPLLLTWGGMGLAERFACQSEIIIFHCSDPSWLGELITGMVFAHWFAIITIPSAILGAIGMVISLILKVNPSRTKVNISGIPSAAFYRSRRHKVIAGVCSAIGQRWKVPIQGVRIVTVILAVVIPGLFLLVYIWFWLAFPLEPPIEPHLVNN
ncbi:PspC domain-containing protein [Kamptonema animale CS-326]|jgi:phage shock protein C|uniref:PspC domain-containing protein n=1 Tax=Kamptonema animale TaxID=92934 RepID=UPI00232C71A8|nr:PspC domain-containing protein [Kamptonema animale]MDB9511407.1 PspC domain-containing protein [Kamptonema animale CS-326]